MKLSVIMPCYNSARTVAAQLDALTAQRWNHPWEVIVADNGSTDDSVAIIQQYRNRLPNLQILDASARQGASFARNTAAKVARGEFLLFCDSDDVADSGWLAAMGNALMEHEFVASRFEIRRLNSESLAGRAFIKGTHPQETGLQTANYPPYLLHAACAALGIHKTIYSKVGGLDETMMALEDPDLCFRVQLAGHKLVWIGDAVMHYRSRSTLKGWAQQIHNWSLWEAELASRYQPQDAGIRTMDWIKALARSTKRIVRLTARMARMRSREEMAMCTAYLASEIGKVRGGLRVHAPPL
jgi:glycosyltransferase involved in cell wall biosynthesis